jgi:hypothetical protein
VRREQSLANRARRRIAARVRFGIKPKVDGGAARGERWALGRVFPGSRGIAKLQDVKAYKFTDYFENEVLRKRPYLQKEWCIQVLENPIRSEPQEKNRFRLGSHHVHETGRPHQVTGPAVPLPHIPEGDLANKAVEPTPNSLRSCLAPAIGRGSPLAFGMLKNTFLLIIWRHYEQRDFPDPK